MWENADAQRYDDIQASLNRRCLLKKRVNLILPVLGVTSFLYGLRLQKRGRLSRLLDVFAAYQAVSHCLAHFSVSSRFGLLRQSSCVT